MFLILSGVSLRSPSGVAPESLWMPLPESPSRVPPESSFKVPFRSPSGVPARRKKWPRATSLNPEGGRLLTRRTWSVFRALSFAAFASCVLGSSQRTGVVEEKPCKAEPTNSYQPPMPGKVPFQKAPFQSQQQQTYPRPREQSLRPQSPRGGLRETEGEITTLACIPPSHDDL